MKSTRLNLTSMVGLVILALSLSTPTLAKQVKDPIPGMPDRDPSQGPPPPIRTQESQAVPNQKVKKDNCPESSTQQVIIDNLQNKVNALSSNLPKGDLPSGIVFKNGRYESTGSSSIAQKAKIKAYNDALNNLEPLKSALATEQDKLKMISCGEAKLKENMADPNMMLKMQNMPGMARPNDAK